MKRLLAGVTATLLAVILLFSLPTSALSAKSAILMDGTTGRILFNKDANRKSLIASTTKIMTCLVVCEQCNVLDRMRIPKAAVGIEGSSMYLQEGEVLTIQELLYGLMLHSGNDAAVALAIYCAGTVEGFVEKMNDKARSLGLSNTHFENPNGLDSEHHYSTAGDLAVLSAYAMQNPIFQRIVSTKTIGVTGRVLRNHNKLLWQIEGVDGIKTGYTRAAGRILVSSALRQGRRLVAVTICAPNDWQDHTKLLQAGFENFKVKTVVETGARLGFAEIAGGQQASVAIIAKEAFTIALRDDETVEIVLPQPGFVYAPVAAGQDAGYAQVYIDGCWLGTIPILYGDTVEQISKPEPKAWERILRGNHI